MKIQIGKRKGNWWVWGSARAESTGKKSRGKNILEEKKTDDIHTWASMMTKVGKKNKNGGEFWTLNTEVTTLSH